MPVEILDFFRALGVPLSGMYGLSSRRGRVPQESVRCVGTVGRAIPGEELQLAATAVLSVGERVPRLSRRPGARRVLDADGWLHTGDVGVLDGGTCASSIARGAHHHRERQERVAREPRSALKAQPLIGQACAIGDGEPYLVALVVLDPDVPVWAARQGIAGRVDAASLSARAADDS